MRNVYLATLFVCVLLFSILGLRGTKFIKPPLDAFPEWAFPGMKYQPKLRPQATSEFFADGRADRMPPPHVVRADAPLRDNSAVYAGKDAKDQFIRGFPAGVTVDAAFIRKGQAIYTINCVPCHGVLGDGNGITKQYGMGATPSYHDDRLRKIAEGEIYNVITNGKANMLSYADKVAPEDRWAVIAYVRALQRAQQGTAADVPADKRKELGL